MKGTRFSVFVMSLVVTVLLASACQRAVSTATPTQEPPPTATPEPSPTPTQEPPPTATPEPPATAAPEPPPTAASQPSHRILFIGNSFSGGNLGIHRHMIGLAASAGQALTIETSSVLNNEGLYEHWEAGKALEAIQEANWDVVVLQQGLRSGDDTEQRFYEYTRRFDGAIKEIGAHTVLFMPWPGDPFGGPLRTTEDIARALSNIGAELGVKVAPVGLAFARSSQERPALDMYDSDGLHASTPGTYLATCVLYATIYGQSPEGCSYQPADMIAGADSLKSMWKRMQMTEDEVAFLQRIAWETVVEYEAQK